MIKKLNLFFSSQLRKRLESDRELQVSRGLTVLLTFASKVLATSLKDQIMPEVEARALGGGAWKFFDGCHAESNSIRRAVHAAYRVESTGSLPLNPDWLGLTISFFKKGERRPFYELETLFHRETGESGSIAEHHIV